MSTDATLGWSTLFQSGNGATPEVFATFAEVTGITPPALSRDTVDATHELSPEAWREFIAGLKDGGEVSFDMNFVPDSVEAASLMAELDAQGRSAVKNRKVIFPDGSYFTFAAILTGYEPDSPLDDKMSAAVTFKVTGKPILVQV